MMKKDPCCARRHSNVLREEAEVRRLARMIQTQESRGRRTESYRAQLDRTRANLDEARQALADHRRTHTAVVPIGQVLV